MNNNFKNYIDLSEQIAKFGAILFPENFAWAKSIGSSLPNLQLDLPTIEKKAKIEIVMDKKNPISIQLSDGSKLFFTYDEYKRIEGVPERGKTLIVTMQRHPLDKSNLPSKIIKCRVV